MKKWTVLVTETIMDGNADWDVPWDITESTE